MSLFSNTLRGEEFGSFMSYWVRIGKGGSKRFRLSWRRLKLSLCSGPLFSYL